MKENRITQSDIDKIRRRLDLLLKYCERYMHREQPDYNTDSCEKCLTSRRHEPTPSDPCLKTLHEETRILAMLCGIGIYDTGVRPPTIPRELRHLSGRVRIFKAPNAGIKPLTKSKT